MESLSRGEQRTLRHLIENVAHLDGVRATSRHIALKTKRSRSTISKHLSVLGESGYINVQPGGGKRCARVTQVMEKGLRYQFPESRPGGQRKLPLEISESSSPKPSNGDTPPAVGSDLPLVTIDVDHLLEELVKIRELVKPRPWESTYDAVKSLHDHAYKK